MAWHAVARRGADRRAVVWHAVARRGAVRRGAVLASRHRAELASLAVAVVLAGIWLAAPPMGTDLSAQVARADFFAAHGWAPIDFRWYGGISPHAYSVVTPPLMAWFGVRPVGAVAAVVSAVALAALMRRTGAARPVLGGVLGAACFTGNLVSGRVTFAVGVALGLLALLALVPLHTSERERSATPGGWVARAATSAFLAAFAAAAASPVAGLFVGLAGVALWCGAERPPRKYLRLGGLALVVGAAVPILVMAGRFGAGGWMNMSRSDMVHAAVASVAVAILVPSRVVRLGAVLSAAGVLAAYLLHTPVGLNATRLATLFALPVVAAYAVLPRLPRGVRLPTVAWLVPVLALLAWWQPPVLDRDLATIGDPASSPDFFAPLQAALAGRQPQGRVEVVPTVNYWESAYVDAAPLARGWLRQVDLDQNPLFFDGTLDARSYRDWLEVNGVSHVALPHSEISWIGRREAELVRQGLPYLNQVWANQDWTLYEVVTGPGIVWEITDGTNPVIAPARLVAAAPDRLVIEVPAPGDFVVRVRWSRWLTVTGPAACLDRFGTHAVLRATAPGTYTITGTLAGRPAPCPEPVIGGAG